MHIILKYEHIICKTSQELTAFPESILTVPVIAPKRVDFPAPLIPTIPHLSFSCTDQLMFFKRGSAPRAKEIEMHI